MNHAALPNSALPNSAGQSYPELIKNGNHANSTTNASSAIIGVNSGNPPHRLQSSKDRQIGH